MENEKVGGVWFEDLLQEKLSGTEKLWRDIYRVADEFFLMIRFVKMPITYGKPQYELKIAKPKKDKWILIYQSESMEVEPMLKKCKKFLEDYRAQHKQYIIQKLGGGEFI